MINLDMEVKGTTVEEQSQATGSFDPIPEGTYNVSLDKFGEWEQTTSRDGKTTYPMAEVELTITDGDFAGRKLWDTLRIHPNTPWKASNFLGCFAGEGVTAPLSQFGDLVGNHGRVTVEQNKSTKIVKDEYGLDVEEDVIYSNVKNYLVTEEENEAPELDINSDDLPW